jgi:hypothetical protein
MLTRGLVDPTNFRFWILDFGFFRVQAPPRRILDARILNFGFNLKYSLRCVRYANANLKSKIDCPKPRTQGVVGVNPKDAPASLTLRYRKSKIQNCLTGSYFSTRQIEFTHQIN